MRAIYEFGPFRLDATERVLARGGETVRLTPKEFETLLALVRNSGHLMTKGELLKEVWPDTFVEEATLAQNIFTLRKALGRGAPEGAGQYIETVPRRGYRFVAGVRELKEETSAAGGEAPGAGAAAANADGVVAAEAEAEPSPSRNGASPAERNGHAAGQAVFSEAGAVSGGAGARTADETAESAASRLRTTEGRGHPVRAAVLISLAVVLVFAGVVLLVFKFVVRRQTAPPSQRQSAFESMQVTRLPVTGDVREAVISPDGKYVAYVANDPGRQSILVRQVSANSNVQQLVAPAAATGYAGLAFSPDAEHLYYVAFKDNGPETALHQVPVLGGAAKKVLDSLHSPITFSPDGRRIAFVRNTRRDTGGAPESSTLFVADADGANARALVTHALPEICGLPAWSPRGDTIAYVLGTSESYDFGNVLLGVATLNVADGKETRVTPERWMGISQLAWLPDASGLLLSAAERELSPSQIWRLSLADGEVRRVTNDLNIYLGASMTADASALVTVQTDRAPNIWVAPQGDAARAEQITSGTGKLDGIYGVSWAPDGRVVYASVASGNWDIWMMDADGRNQRQLTVDARSNYGPSVSPDGRHVVFVSN
ncbi:MAG TPA: winged helix-turn-helix domain-containing protein, partial [Pyrinomonadaceae bacterium]